MPIEQLQNLITAIEALIHTSQENNAAAEARILQEMENAKLTEVQNEAVAHLLMALKAEKERKEADDEAEGSQKQDHMAKMHANMEAMFGEVKKQLQTDSSQLTAAIKGMTTALTDMAQEVKKKEQYAYDIKVTPALAKKLKGEDGKTPVKGKDYYTSADKKELVAEVLPLAAEKAASIAANKVIQDTKTELRVGLAAMQAQITPEALAQKVKKQIKFDDIEDAPKIEQAVAEVRRAVADVKKRGNATGTLDELTNVDTQGVQDGQVIYWNATTKTWRVKTVSGGGTSDHELLTNLLGGQANQHYHLTQAEHSTLTNGTLDIADGLHLHSKTVLTVRNETGATIPSGKMVYMSGFNNVPLIALANNTQPNQHHYIGITQSAIADQTNGVIVTGGLATGIDTDPLGIVGTELFLTTNGNLTATMPTSGTVIVVGNVAVKQNNGSILLIPNSTGAQYVAAAQAQDVHVRMGDIAGANKVTFENYNDTEVGSIDSLGNAAFAGNLNLAAGKTYRINGVDIVYTDEKAQDAVGNAVDSQSLAYDDPSGAISVKIQASIVKDASGLKLSGDSATPGNSKYYGTDGTGAKGFFALPAPGGGGAGSIAFGLSRSTGLVNGDKIKVICPFAGTITGWVVATNDGNNSTITLSTKKAAYASVPSFTAIDGGAGERIALSAANKNNLSSIPGWTTAVAADDHFEISVASVTGTVVAIYGIIKITKS